MKKKFDFTQKNSRTKSFDSVGDMVLSGSGSDHAELRFYGDIVSSTWDSYSYSEDKCPQDIVDFLAELGEYKTLDIYINSGGGSVFGGLAIYNILKRYKGEKVVHVDGIAASIASVIALVGDRVIVPATAQVMMHKPWSIVIGNADELRHEADALDNCQKSIMAVYLEHMKDGVTKEQIEELVNAETWLTGEMASAYFSIEVEEKSEIAACNSNYFERYKNTPDLVKSQLHQKNKNTIYKLQTELNLLSL